MSLDQTPWPFARVLRTTFWAICENGYGALWGFDETDEENNPESLREDFDRALGETLAHLSIADTAENLGEAGDLVLESWKPFASFLTETTQ